MNGKTSALLAIKSVVKYPAFALLASILISSAFGDDFTFGYQRDIQVEGRVSLKLEYITGDLALSVNPENLVTIDAVKRVKAVTEEEAADVAAHIEILCEKKDHDISLTTRYLRIYDRGETFWQKVLGKGSVESFGSVDWHISVPPDCHVTVVNSSGRITAAGLSGNFSVRTSAGDILLNSLEGKIDIDNVSGSTLGELLVGPVTVRQPNGKVALHYIDGDIRIKSEAAEIDVVQDRGALDITSVTSSIKIQTGLESQRDCFVETVSGDINFIIPEWSSGILSLVSKSGEISAGIPLTVRSMSRHEMIGELGMGGIKVSLVSNSGDVIVGKF